MSWPTTPCRSSWRIVGDHQLLLRSFERSDRDVMPRIRDSRLVVHVGAVAAVDADGLAVHPADGTLATDRASRETGKSARS